MPAEWAYIRESLACFRGARARPEHKYADCRVPVYNSGRRDRHTRPHLPFAVRQSFSELAAELWNTSVSYKR